MNQIKTLAALAIAAFALLSNVFALIGYTPPLALDHLLHLTSEQITSGAAVLLAFLAPLHQLAGDALAAVREFLARGAIERAETAKLRADFESAMRQIAALQAAQAAASAQAAQLIAQPTSQSGRSLLSHLAIVLIASGCAAWLLSLAACSTTAPSTPQSMLTGCTLYADTLNALAPQRSHLSASQVAAVDQAVAIAGPICSGPLPADPAAALMSLSRAVASLQAVTPAPAPAASAASR